MEIILLVVLGGLAVWWFLLRENKKTSDFSTSAPYKIDAPEQKATEPTPCACGRSSTGFCVGLHKLSNEEWAVHADNPNKIATEAPKPAGSLDVNNDGKVNFDDVKEVVKKAKTKVKKAADVDGDGRVTKADAKAAASKVKAKATAKKKAKTSKK